MNQASSKPTRPQASTKREIWDLKWIREPQQTRSAKTRAKLLDAAEELIEKEGMQGITVAKVTKLASSSVGSFYHYFQDKEALVYAVFERINAEALATAKQGLDPEDWADVPLTDIIEGYVRFSLKRGKLSPGIMQAQQKLEIEDPFLAERIQKFRQEIQAALMALLKPKFHQVDHENPLKAVELMLEVVRNMVSKRLESYVPGNPPAVPKLSDEDFIQELCRLAAAYLQASSTD
ncbi:MAG: TetR/AcrR family transcriptional regulator [Gammaproteobacteria bacterium]|jgi:AcrR family transcriptional regulator|nr:TetR/AcrR family transcriptional regulator [Gammaproteobacteria bacterium]MBT4493634.1 TetR/AcrR family transcriptional regulator [Gammaproteobacteria bacterium]MBT7371930.1 TetR/AcrR family transcriptional regulator [Gammaproteobacteria bacterium]